MTKSRYAQFDADSMILRDHLAVERTAMANERTLLSYVRTMIGIIAVGGTILKLFEGWWYAALGIVIIGLGLFVMLIGFVRYARISITLHDIYHERDWSHQTDWMHSLLWLVLDKLRLAKI